MNGIGIFWCVQQNGHPIEYSSANTRSTASSTLKSYFMSENDYTRSLNIELLTRKG